MERFRKNEEIKNRQEQEMFERHLAKFIGTMEMPCYNRMTNFYYYDVLEALSRHLFQQIIDHKKEKLEMEMGFDTESSSDDDISMSRGGDNSGLTTPREK